MKLNKLAGATSEIWQVFIQDSSSTTGAGLTGLVFNTGSLTAYYHRDTDTTATAITLVTMTVGTFTSSGFKEIDATNMPGWYQFCPPNAAIAAGAKSCGFHLKGATNMAPLPIEVQLTAYSPDDSVRLGLTALPNATAGANTGLPVVGTQVPNATAGAANGLLIAGSNAATTFAGLTTGALSCTTITASGAVAFQSTFAVTTSTSLAALSATTITASGTTSLAALTTSGTVTLNALTVSNATTLTGAVSLGSTLGVTGTTTLAALNTGAIGTGNLTITGTLSTSGTATLNALTISNATTLTGAVSATNGSNDIRGILLGANGSVALGTTVRTNGAAGTLPQLLNEILLNITESNNSGTTRTVNGYDHTTPVATYTYDNATPNTITRAT